MSMEPITITNTKPTPRFFVPQFPFQHFARIYVESELRPPIYDEMVGDMGNLINKVVSPFVNPNCVELHFEEMVANCWLKTTDMNTNGLIERSNTRCEYFAQYKVAISNHVYSLVQKHIYTEKRTGVKPPPKDKRHKPNEPHYSRPVELRIDDPDANVQLSEVACGDDSVEFRELMEEVALRLTECEKNVLNQLVSPNEASLTLARLEAERGRLDGEPLRIRINTKHLAEGIGLEPCEFNRIHERIKEKCLFMKNTGQEDPRYTAAMATLLQFFNVQVPRSLPDVIHKRVLMIAAQHQYDKVLADEGIQAALSICGIPLPEIRTEVRNGSLKSLKCYGVLFQKHHRLCEQCGWKESCEVQAANFGLGEIAISHRLLGASHKRTPVVRPVRHVYSAITEDERETEILTFLDENFHQITHMGEICYRHKDRLSGKGMQLIFSAGKQTSPLRLRFIDPSEEVKAGLEPLSTERGGRKAWYLPENVSINDAIGLIQTHAKLTYVNK